MVSPVKVQIKHLYPFSKTPSKKYETDAGLDLFSYIDVAIHPGMTVKLDCGIAVNIPPGFYGFILPRSSWRQKGLICKSVYDAGFQGTVEPFVTNGSNSILYIQREERILQLLIHPVPPIELEVVTDFIPSERGTCGAGSSGRF